jgi:cytochrome b involved in lipid metabolism
MKSHTGIFLAAGSILAIITTGGYVLSSALKSNTKQSPVINSSMSSTVAPSHSPTSTVEQQQGTKTYSRTDVAKHNSVSDCWMVIQNSVYDVTAYIPEHPNEKILDGCGKDATTLFEEVKKHQERATSLLEQFTIGSLL